MARNMVWGGQVGAVRYRVGEGDGERSCVQVAPRLLLQPLHRSKQPLVLVDEPGPAESEQRLVVQQHRPRRRGGGLPVIALPREQASSSRRSCPGRLDRFEESAGLLELVEGNQRRQRERGSQVAVNHCLRVRAKVPEGQRTPYEPTAS